MDFITGIQMKVSKIDEQIKKLREKIKKLKQKKKRIEEDQWIADLFNLTLVSLRKIVEKEFK